MTADKNSSPTSTSVTKPNDKKPGEKKPGKQHYNPVNMSGREAGIVEEMEEKSEENEKDDAPTSRKPPRPNHKR